MPRAVDAPHVVMLSSPGVGHVAPMVELARQLAAAHHGLTSTIVTYTNLSSPASSSALSSLPPGVSTAALPEVPIDDLPADTHIVTRILTVVHRTLPHLRTLLRSLIIDSPSPAVAGVTVFLADLLCPAALAVAQELGVPRRYVFYPSSLLSLSALLEFPRLARAATCEFRDLPEPVVLPGRVAVHGADLPEPCQDRASPVFALVVDLCLDYLRGDGFVVHTLDAMERETLEAFRELSDKGVYPPAYAVGPFLRSSGESASAADEHHHCMRWLDGQPDGSVLYVCFGSGGTLSSTQTAELAAGLEASAQRFLWVVRLPSDKDSCAAYFGAGDVDGGGGGGDPVRYLPAGFTERTRGTGLVVPQWAPQVEILGHRAVGGFLSHCGWNSTLETVSSGVPVLAWPLFAEQRMNAVKLEHVGVALRVSAREDGVVPREEVAAVTAELMAGEKGAMARKKARQLQAEARKASVPGGPAHQALAALVHMWKCAPSGPAVAAGGRL